MDFFAEFCTAFQTGHSGFQFMWLLVGIGLTACGIIIERLISLGRRTNVDIERFVEELRELIAGGRIEEAYQICKAGGKRALPQVLRAGIKRAQTVPQMVRAAMEEECLQVIPAMERRLNVIAVLGNISTLIGLMGTIYGLIIAFAAVAQPGVSPSEKSSMLAVGISAAMNTTLLGLIIAVPCVFIFSMIRTRIDETVAEIDRCAVSIIKVLTPYDIVQKSYKVSGRRIREEVETETNMVPFMNLMVTLIPLLLSSANFIKIGAIELKLPEAAQGAGGGGTEQAAPELKLDLGIVVSSKGFNLFHYFKSERGPAVAAADTGVQIPLLNNEYDYASLSKELAEIKRRALLEIVRSALPSVPQDQSLERLYREYVSNGLAGSGPFKDHEEIKIVAEDKIRYQVIVSVMDAARGTAASSGKVALFPNVSIAGGIL
jgi:biopolymer transport protein ExbB